MKTLMSIFVVFVFSIMLFEVKAQNTEYGTGAGNAGTDNSSFGAYAGDVITGGSGAFFGADAGRYTTTGNYNAFLGYKSGYNNTSGSQNTYLGAWAGWNSSTGLNNSFLGYQSGIYTTSGIANSFVGHNAGYQNTTGGNNTFMGGYAGSNSTTGTDNTAIGYNAGPSSGNLTQTIAIGYNATATADYDIVLQNSTNRLVSLASTYNLFAGYQSGWNNTSGTQNTYLGTWAGYNASTGGNNAFMGSLAGYYNATGSYNTAVGHNAGPSSGGLNNTTAIGYNASVSVNFGIVSGNVKSKIGIRQSSPLYALHVQSAYCDGNTWYNASDQNLKKNFRSISNEGILDKVMKLKIERWNYIADESEADHIGPIAQDFNKIFELGGNDKAISSVDEVGIALAAIQELNIKTDVIKDLSKKITELETLLSTQQVLINSLLSQKAGEGTGSDIRLFQNTPNPFNRDTEIRMDIPQKVNQATLYLYDLQGRVVDTRIVHERGVSTITIEGGRLSAGVYLYALIADHISVGMKRMILTD